MTKLPAQVTALELAELYRQRWKIEHPFQRKGLGKPRTSLFAFVLAWVASNAMAVGRAHLRQDHGVEQEAEVSGSSLAAEVAADYRTLRKYLPAEHWLGGQRLEAKTRRVLRSASARHVNVKALQRSSRAPTKPPKEKPVYNRNHRHFSIARLLNEPKNTC